MASLTENSLASVPLSRLAHAHEKLLVQNQSALQPQASNKSHATYQSASLSQDVEAIISGSTNVHNTPKASYGPPRLSASKSASAVEMESTVNPSPSQEAFMALTRASSFHGYRGGDTQPMESQVYRDFTEAIAKPNMETPKKHILKANVAPDGRVTYDTVAVHTTPETDQDGDTGFVELENAYQPTSPAARSISPSLDELLDNSQSQPELQHNIAKPARPETPAVVGHKRKRNGDILTSPSTNKKTPGFSQFFGGAQKGQLLSATQLFDQTQAPSSPMPNEVRSDPITSRPSPNIQNNFAVSSPTVPMSSPMTMMHSRPATAGDPRDQYTSMRDSQERRARRFRQDFGLLEHLSNEFIEGENEEDIAEARVEQRRKQRAMSEQAFREWSRVRAPSRPGSRSSYLPTSSPHQPLTIDLVTPAVNRREPPEFDPSDDGKIEGQVVIVKDDEADSGNETDDEYDELAQTVLRSQRDIGDKDEEIDEQMENDNLRNARPQEERINGNAAQEQSQHDEEHIEKGPTSTAKSAIADSQPLQQAAIRLGSQQQARQLHLASSIIPGSQYNVQTALDQPRNGLPSTDLSGKMPTIPDSDGHRVPSSPPLRQSSVVEEDHNINRNPSSMHAPIRIGSINDMTAGLDKEVPESDQPDRQIPSSPANEENGTRGSHTEFVTAPTHRSESGGATAVNVHAISPLKAFVSQQSKVASQSPRATAGVRRFADFAAEASPLKASGEMDVDVDAIVSDVVTADDEDFMNAVGLLSPYLISDLGACSSSIPGRFRASFQVLSLSESFPLLCRR